LHRRFKRQRTRTFPVMVKVIIPEGAWTFRVQMTRR
jgi:hypothetical protein